MNLKFQFTIVLLLLMTYTYGQFSVIGNWKVEDPGNQSKFIIRSDSTFSIEADTSIKVTFLNVVQDNNYKGNWEQPDNKHLTLWSDSKNKVFFPFKILKLLRNKMILKYVFDKSKNKSGNISLIRL